MKFMEAMILRWCIACDNEAASLKSNGKTGSENSQTFVDERGLMLLQGQEIPEELIYDND